MSAFAASYMRHFLPAIFFQGQYDLLKRWLACQRITFFPMVAMFVSIVIHICNCLVLVHKFDMGINGLAIAASITNFFLLVSVFMYAYCSSQIRNVM